MKSIRYGITCFVILLLLVACGKKDKNSDNNVIIEPTPTPPIETETVEPEPTPTPEPEEVEESLEGKAINPLTGLYIDEEAAIRRPVGIMINNLEAALPQSGLAQADIIYETLVEGAICRLFALYQDFDATKIGPVRSARHYFLDFAFDFDAIYVHYGQSDQALAAFSSLNAPNLNGLSYLDEIMCFQDPERVRPHSTYTSYDGLMKAWDMKGYRKERSEDVAYKFNFNETEVTPDGLTANKVTLSYSYYSEPWFEYDDDLKLYYRFQYGEEHIDKETGEQLKYKNIIVQFADMWQIKGDAYGRLDMNLITKGTGYYISNGKAIPITWEKKSHYDPTQYYTEDGQPLLINPGKTWISIFPSYRKDKMIIE